LEEFFESCPSRPSNSAIRTPGLTQLGRQRLDQLLSLRKPLKQLLNRRHPRHPEIIDNHDRQIKQPHRVSRSADLASYYATTYESD
jgi:hypothetical protein